jgi:hypothetical protein
LCGFYRNTTIAQENGKRFLRCVQSLNFVAGLDLWHEENKEVEKLKNLSSRTLMFCKAIPRIFLFCLFHFYPFNCLR